MRKTGRFPSVKYITQHGLGGRYPRTTIGKYVINDGRQRQQGRRKEEKEGIGEKKKEEERRAKEEEERRTQEKEAEERRLAEEKEEDLVRQATQRSMEQDKEAKRP